VKVFPERAEVFSEKRSYGMEQGLRQLLAEFPDHTCSLWDIGYTEVRDDLAFGPILSSHLQNTKSSPPSGGLRKRLPVRPGGLCTRRLDGTLSVSY